MDQPAEQRFLTRRQLLAQWAGWGLPVLAWFTHLNASYLLVGWVCESGAVAALHAVSAACLLAAALGVAIAWRHWRAVGSEWPDGRGGARLRSRFMAATGVLMGALFCAIIVAQALPNFMVPPCL